MDRDSLLELSEILRDSLQQFSMNHHQSIAQFLGRDLFRLSVVNYNPQKKESTFGSSALKADQKRNILYNRNDVIIDKWKHTDRAAMKSVGETEYFQEQVLHGPGASFLGEDIINLFNKLKLKAVAEIKYLDAARIAYAMISATSNMTEKVPAPSGIGGPIQIVLINGKPPNGSVELKGPFVPTTKKGGSIKRER